LSLIPQSGSRIASLLG